MSLVFSKTNQNDRQEVEAQRLAGHYPRGQLWLNTRNRDSNLGKLLYATAAEFLRQLDFTQKINNELYINETVELIERWEESLGIPDGCFSTDEDLTTRRLQIIQKLINYGGVQTEQDFKDVALLFGFTIVVSRPGTGATFPLDFPLTFFGGVAASSKNTIFIQVSATDFVFPLPFPLQFSASTGVILECIFQQLVPVTTEVIFQFGS